MLSIEPFRRELSEIAAPSRTVNQEGESGHALDQMTYRFALDKDSDVRSFVMSFVDPDILEKQREKEMKAAVQAAEAAIEARAEENSNFDEDEEAEADGNEDEDDEDDDEHDDEGKQDKKMVIDEAEKQEQGPMQEVESELLPEKKPEQSVEMEPMDILNNSAEDEDEIMSEADTLHNKSSTTKTPLNTSTPTTAVVLPQPSTEG